MIGKLGNVVLEARDPRGLARFYSEVLGMPITRDDGGWVDVGDGTAGPKLSFQHAPGHQPPTWPDPASSMQYHFDIDIDVDSVDIDAAEATVLALGATRLPWGSAEEEAQGLREPSDSGFRVFADPAGHPFCLCWG
jgi:catechol 2,3-dioxygenase-like lactoylglutathione lyase family enzyme